MEKVTKAQFTRVLDEFTNHQPSNASAPLAVLVARIRHLLDHLDALAEQLSLRVTNTLFDALSNPNCLSALVFLLSDVSARSSPVVTDVRKSFRYPYLVANILANGTMSFREVFIASKSHVAHLLSFLDGCVALSGTDPVADYQEASTPTFAYDNPVIIGNVVQILVSYLETNPEALLPEIRDRPATIPSLVKLLYVGSVPKLLNSLIPDRCVDDLTSLDPGRVSFEAPMMYALGILAGSAIFQLLADAFVHATQTIYSALCDQNADHERELHSAEQLSYNVIAVFGTLFNKTVRALRLQPNAEQYRNLRIFSGDIADYTLKRIVQAGIELFQQSGTEYKGQLHLGLGLAIDVLKYVAQDQERRVASVSGQPPPLDVGGFEQNAEPFLRQLMEVLMDVARSPKHGQTRLLILELFVEVQRVCSDVVVAYFDRMQFGSVAFQMMVIHPHNSLLHHVVCQGVESALVSDACGVRFAQHWLQRCRLVEKIMREWRGKDGDAHWSTPTGATDRPYLSALIHMACCVEHWAAMTRDGGEDPLRLVSVDVMREFESFCEDVVHKVMEEENQVLGGPKPRRRPGRVGGGSFGRSFGSFGMISGAMLRRGGTGTLGGRAHLVRSPSAHRFGYVPPANTSRSRLDDVFAENGGGRGSDAFAGLSRSGATSFANVFDMEDEATL